jgi:hypothetical protein
MSYKSVIINSIPKSGTYLLNQLVSALGSHPKAADLHFNDQHYTTGADAKGALTVVKIPAPDSFTAIPEGTSVPAHLTWSREVEGALENQNIGMFFMYRDPRDIVISYIKYAMYSEIYRYETEGHKQYYDFLCTLENDQRRTEHVLSHRLFLFQFYENAPWLFSKACMPIAFEKLLTDVTALREGKVGTTISNIMRYLNIDALPVAPEILFEQVYGKGKTSMLDKKSTSSHAEFYDDGLRKAAEDSYFKSVLYLYGYYSY